MDNFSEAQTHQLPAAISSLIDGAFATFDSDRDAARRYLQRASSLLRAQWARTDPDFRHASKSLAGSLAAWKVNRVLDYIETHLPHKITLGDLASLIHVSRGQLCRGFKISVGVSPYRFIARKRVELACVMLKSSREPLSQVAISCGLYDQSHFCRVFRHATGVSPAAWRRANAIDPNRVARRSSFPTDRRSAESGRVAREVAIAALSRSSKARREELVI